jgi:pimeloyl-ACP methyl ester carboxylesterase
VDLASPLPGVLLLEAAPADEADAALKEYPKRLDGGEAALRKPTNAGEGRRALRFWMVGDTPETGVEVVSCGDGPPVLFVPGIGLTAPVFHEQFKLLSSDWSVLAIHAPGHGRSKPPRIATTAALADKIAETLLLLGVRRPIHVVASCFGTVAVQHLAAHRPDLIASLTLCGAFSEELAMAPFPTEGLSAKDIAGLTEAAAKSLSADFDHLIGASENAELRPIIEQARHLLLSSQRASPVVGMRYLNEVLTLRPSEWAQAIVAPTLFVVGTLDTVVAPQASVKAAARMQRARVLEIAGAGHYPFLTHASVFNAGLIDFLRNVEA